jgi:hypothetical protein
MNTNFVIYNAETVPSNYSWDNGLPFVGINTANAYATTSYTSGYAPGLKVLFYNRDSQSDFGFDEISYNWDFGDYYNDTNNNISLSCTSLVEHTYIMPGIYTVSLRHIQSRRRTNLDPSVQARLCLGKYDVNWYWSNLECGKLQQATWDQTMCVPPSSVTSPRPKWWDSETQCFQRYCKFWSWYDLANYSDSENPIRWSETITDADFEKLWMFENNETNCTAIRAQFLDTVEVKEQNAILPLCVEVIELPPVAEISCTTTPVGITPHTVTLSPTGCQPGSFSIDRIDWDLGDGTPVFTHTRYAPPSGSNIHYNGKYPSDINDVRNYDIIHTYVRDAKSYPVFYPSLTCYSANTNTKDSCSTTVGPISIPNLSNIVLVKARNTVRGNLYAFDINNSLAFTTTTPTTGELLIPLIPKDRLLITSTTTNPYFGNPNNNLYPPIYTPSCQLLSSDFLPTTDILTTEDNNPNDEDELINPEEDGIPIITDLNFYIEP